MPILKESDAAAISQTFKLMPEDAKPLASEWLKNYADQQAEWGQPLFPSKEGAFTESRDRTRSMFEDLRKVDELRPDLEQNIKWVPEPDKVRAMAANSALLADHYKIDGEELNRNYERYRDDYAQKLGAKPGLDDLGFYAVAKKEIERQKQAEEMQLDARLAAMQGALGGESDVMKSLAEFQMNNAGAGDVTKDYWGAFLDTSAALRPHRQLMMSLMDSLGRTMDGKGTPEDEQTLQQARQDLVDMPGMERRQVLAALRLQADKAGEASAREKGGRTTAGATWQAIQGLILGGPATSGGRKFIQQEGEAGFRMFEGGVTGMTHSRVAGNLERVADSGEVTFTGAAIETAEDARKYVSESLAYMEMADRPDPSGNPFPLKREGNVIKLTPTAAKLVREAKERREKEIRVSQEMDQIGNVADPIPNVYASTLGTSGAMIGLGAITRGMAAPVMFQVYQGLEYNDLSLKYPAMSHGDKVQIAGLSAGVQAVGDAVEIGIFAKVPGVKSLFTKALAGGMAKRLGKAAAGSALTYGLENVVEAGQDIATPALMATIKADVPGFDWDKENRDFWGNRGDVALGMLPLTLIGLGVGSFSQYKAGKALADWNERAAIMGITEADRAPIAAALAAGDNAKADALLKEAFPRRSKEVAAEAQSKASARQVQAAQTMAEAVRTGLMPTVTAAGDGFTLAFPDGHTVKAANREEMNQLLAAHLTEQEAVQIDAVASLADHFAKQERKGTRQELAESSTIAPGESKTLGDLESTPEQEMDAARVAGQLEGLSPEQAQKTNWAVWGRNRVEQQGNLRASISDVFQNGNVLTQIEETVEGRMKNSVLQKLYSRSHWLTWVRMAEQATGQTFLADPDADVRASPDLPRSLIEAVSAIVVADVMGRRKADSRLPVGAITQGLRAAVKRGMIADDKASGLVQMLRSFRAYFKTVMSRALALKKARKGDKLGTDWEEMLDDLLGVDVQGKYEGTVQREAVAMTEETTSESTSLRPQSLAERVQGSLAQRLKAPEARIGFFSLAAKKLASIRRDSLAFGKHRVEGADSMAERDKAIGDLEKERKANRAARYAELVDEGMAREFTPGARMAYEEGVMALADHPLIQNMLSHGKLMSLETALSAGKDIKDQYDDAPRLPSQWLSTSPTGGIMPDVMADNLGFNGAPAMWDALRNVMDSTAKANAEYRAARAKVRVIEASARKTARDETDAAYTEARSKKPTFHEKQMAALRTLDAILSAFPPEVRARVGGFVKVAGLKTDEARAKEIQRRVEKIDVELEKFLKKELSAEVEKLLKRFKPERDAGDKPKGKLGADVQSLVDAAESAMDIDAVAVAGRLADIQARIDSGELTAEQEILAEREKALIELFGDWKNADAARMNAAFDALEDTATEGWARWKLKQIQRREDRAEMRESLKKDTGKDGTKRERSDRKADDEKTLGKLKDSALNLSSFQEVVSFLFGSKSKTAKAIVDAEREASNEYEDRVQEMGDEVADLFTGLAGGSVLKGEQLRYDMARPSIDAGTEQLSQFQAIQALLMWQQEDGRRHMEGPLDENGKPLPDKWSYDQAWIDSVEKQMTPEARRVMQFIANTYAGEWAWLNPLYADRHGINLPHHDNYAPITVAPQQAKAGEMVDPVSGGTVSGSLLTPGSLRSRNHSAIAEPQFRDALQTLIAHNKQMRPRAAYYDFAVEMQAVLGNREVANSIQAAGGEQAVTVMRKWLDVFAQGGVRDAGAGIAINDRLGRMAGRAAQIAILGRVSTLMVQSTQLGAALAEMPTGAYLSRFGKLMTGQLAWGDAIKSNFIQRRIKAMPPIVRDAMAHLASQKRPNAIKHTVRWMAKLLSGADGLFTSGTYAILLDYHRANARAMGMTGQEAEAFAHTEAERTTEKVAQPMRMGTRSIAEVTNTSPAWRVMWSFASESRQKLALAYWAAANAQQDPARAARAAVVTFLIGGLGAQILRNLWRDLKGDDDEKKWSAQRLALATLTAPLSGVPGYSALTESGRGLFSSASHLYDALEGLASGEENGIQMMRDVETLLSVAGLFFDTPAALASMAHLGMDGIKVIDNAAEE